MFRQQRQRHWLQALEDSVRIWDGVPEQLLTDNVKSLVTRNNPASGALLINPVLLLLIVSGGYGLLAADHSHQASAKQ